MEAVCDALEEVALGDENTDQGPMSPIKQSVEEDEFVTTEQLIDTITASLGNVDQPIESYQDEIAALDLLNDSEDAVYLQHAANVSSVEIPSSFDTPSHMRSEYNEHNLSSQDIFAVGNGSLSMDGPDDLLDKLLQARFLLAQTESDKESLEDQLKEAQSKRKESDMRFAAIERAYLELKGTLSQVESHLNQSKVERDRAIGEKYYLEQRVRELEATVQQLQSTPPPVQTTSERPQDDSEETSMLKAEVERLRNDVETMRTAHRTVETSNEQLKAAASDMEFQLVQIKLSYAETKGNLEDTEAQLEVARAEIAALQYDLKTKKDELEIWRLGGKPSRRTLVAPRSPSII
eukprot:GILJ01003823.1.p1 GENE.GILJ01003823.1~~GILJ01003823.1.p1  ORF type:complete len:365 (-),score=72.89 GILJ01003823.1:176-1222(-)